MLQGAVLDEQGTGIAGALIVLSRPPSGATTILSGASGDYRISGLQPGNYGLRVAKPGFASKLYPSVAVAINRVVVLDIVLAVSPVQEEVTVSAAAPLLEAEVSSSGATIFPSLVEQMPINGRHYLDLMQLVPGVTVNRQVDGGTDAAVPILGERGGNAIFLIDGMPNGNFLDGGSAAPFDQDSIQEFQVLTSGYKAEFGRGSGGVVNVVTRGGSSQWHGQLSAFHRNSALDSSNVPGKETPFLRRWDNSVNLGGPLIKERAFFFGSFERIRETRELNFRFPSGIPDFLAAREKSFDRRNQTFQTRSFFRIDQVLSAHRITGQVSLTNSHLTDFLPLSEAISLPSTRTNLDSRYLMLGLRDTATLGNSGSPFLLTAYLQSRGEPLVHTPAHPEAGPASTLFNLFSGLTTGGLTGDLGQVQFGAGFTPLRLDQRYLSAGAHLEKGIRSHVFKFGWDFQRTRVDGLEAGNLHNQLFATASDFARFGPVNSGIYVLTTVAGPAAEDNRIRLRNRYSGLFVQDDWKVWKSLTLNLGLRWDYYSRFPNRDNFSPRLGLAWSAGPATVIKASWGMFYDHFRLGLARNVPEFGGANLFRTQTISLPRLFYGVPTTLPRLVGLCPSPVLTDAQVFAAGGVCPVAGMSLLGVDRLNKAVAPGHAPIPADTVVTLENVQALTGLNPGEFADAASVAAGREPGFFFWGGFGNLSMNFPVPSIFSIPVTVDPEFRTPYTRAFHLGAQRLITADLVAQADYHHRDIRNMVGVRTTNLAFAARLPGRTGELQPGTGTRPVQSYGPWYQGTYDAISFGVRKRLSRRFRMEAFYTWTRAIDNAFNSSLTSEVQTGRGAGFLASYGPTDAFLGVPPIVADPITGQTNDKGSFLAANGNPVPRAGTFYNGPDLDRGPSDLALNHTLLLHGMVRVPWKLEISGIARAQSGFRFSAAARTPVDVDGDGILNGVDFLAGRNHFQAPGYANLDLRVSRQIAFSKGLHLQAIFESFNLLNRANPAAVQQLQNASTPLGAPLQYLPGREGQVGLRIRF